MGEGATSRESGRVQKSDTVAARHARSLTMGEASTPSPDRARRRRSCALRCTNGTTLSGLLAACDKRPLSKTKMVELRGLEPLTPCLPGKCSTS